MKNDLNDLVYFAAVVQHQGFTSASKALRISKSLLSRRVTELESRLGTRLLNRTSRHFSVTALGEQYSEQCRKVIEQAEIAQQVIDQAQTHPKGKLRVSAPVMMTETLLAPLISAFLKLYPDIHVELLAINRDVDVLEEGMDIVIRAKPFPLEDSDLYLRTLGVQQKILVASSEFISTYKDPITFQNLGKVPALIQTEKVGQMLWTLEHPREKPKKINVSPRLVSNNLSVLFQAAIDGLGVALLPQIACQKALESGQLQQVLHEWHAPTASIHALYSSNKGHSSAFRAFMDYLVLHLGDV